LGDNPWNKSKQNMPLQSHRFETFERIYMKFQFIFIRTICELWRAVYK